MSFSLQFVLVLIGTFMIALVLTPLVRLFSFKIDAVDYPNARRINTKPMPSAGGLSIVIAFSIATLIFIPMLTSTTAPIKKLPILYLAGRGRRMDYRTHRLDR